MLENSKTVKSSNNKKDIYKTCVDYLDEQIDTTL